MTKFDGYDEFLDFNDYSVDIKRGDPADYGCHRARNQIVRGRHFRPRSRRLGGNERTCSAAVGGADRWDGVGPSTVLPADRNERNAVKAVDLL